jgi:YHS domain-containing protein
VEFIMRPNAGRVQFEMLFQFGGAWLLCALLSTTIGADESRATSVSKANNYPAAKAALSQFQDLVGGWIGTGQPKRGSAVGAWREKADWRWKFVGEQAALEYVVEEGKLLKSGLLSFDPDKKTFRLKTVELIEATKEAKEESIERDYEGELIEKKLVLESAGSDSADSRRITITRLNEKRTLVLFERKAPSQNFYSRIAEVGYTREGTRLADSDQTGPVCVVTGGVGTIKVTYKGETYWVCCTGCRDAFDDDPEGVLADYKKKLEEKKAKK